MSQYTELKRRIRGWMELEISRITDDTPDTKTFYFVTAGAQQREFDYIAGQYLTFKYTDIGEKPLIRSYTMSSSPAQEQEIAVTVKRVYEGIVSNWMCDNLKVGDVLKARGPIGKFCYDPEIDNPHLYFVAAGSGVTPFMSIMREYASRLGEASNPESMNLLVSYRTYDDIIGKDLLCELADYKGIRIAYNFTREKDVKDFSSGKSAIAIGRIDAQEIDKFVDHPANSITGFSCGPEPLMDLAKERFVSAGVPGEQFKLESFFS